MTFLPDLVYGSQGVWYHSTVLTSTGLVNGEWRISALQCYWLHIAVNICINCSFLLHLLYVEDKCADVHLLYVSVCVCVCVECRRQQATPASFHTSTTAVAAANIGCRWSVERRRLAASPTPRCHSTSSRSSSAWVGITAQPLSSSSFICHHHLTINTHFIDCVKCPCSILA